MNHIVQRESVDMRTFASESCNIADELEATAAHLSNLLTDASAYMQDASGQEAISILEELIEQVTHAISDMRAIADRIAKSAALLEQSDTLL
jgi:hypothetical protein